MKYSIGQQIYYRGDQANHEGWFEITRVNEGTYDMKELNGDRFKRSVLALMIHDVDMNNGSTRFVTREARETLVSRIFDKYRKTAVVV